MNPARFAQIEGLYRSALSREPADRGAFLDEACGGDAELRRRLESLLGEDAGGDELLDGPVSDLLADLSGEHLAEGTRLGHYRIEGLLGAGGMGEVYLAHDLELDRRVAIKVLPERLAADSVARERLRREALAAAALDHPFLCKIHEVGEDGGSLYFVMEYVRGETLLARMRAGRMALGEALRIAGEIAEAIEDAHANRIVHRDLKPGNVMLTVQGHVKVMDFGLAKRVEGETDAGLTGSGAISGTAQYMSPEQMTGGAVDQRADLFAFGILLAELVNGKHPFLRNSPMETMTAILRDPPELSAGEGSSVPAGLLAVIRRLLAKPREERYGSMREVRTDLSDLGGSLVLERVETPAVRLIGREEERGRILRLLEDALGGRGSLVLISGEPGIGKTHLTRAILADAARRGCFTVAGHCYEGEGAPPFVPFIEMLEHSARALPRDVFRNALGDAAPEVAKLMPELRRIFPDIPPAIELPPEQQRRFLFNAYREFVERAARATPFVAVFEDLHWADEPALLLLQHLVQTLGSLPALVIGTYRDVELDVNRPFVRTLETLVREKQATQISLRRLPLERTGELLAAFSGQAPPSAVTQIVFDHTEGNPFFVEEVFRHLADEGRLLDSQGGWRQGLRADELQVPQGVRLVIGRRMERLPEEARRVLVTAAVIGRSFSLALLEELETGGPDAVLDAIERAERARLVEAESAGREPRYRFVHELIRQTLASGLSLPRRQRSHARVAEAIEKIYSADIEAHAGALAHHLYQAGAAADEKKAAQWLARAAKQAVGAAAFEDALDHLDRAVSLMGSEASARVAELHVERGSVLRSLGRMPEAVAALERSLALFEANGEIDRFAETCFPLVMIHGWNARMEEASEVCRRGLALLGATDSPTRVFLLYGTAIQAALANDIETALPILREAEAYPLPPHPMVMRTASLLRTHARFICAQLEPAYQAAAETQRLCEEAGDVWGQMDVAWIRAGMAIHLGRLEEAVSIAREAIPLSERIGHWGNAFFCRDQAFQERFAAGDFECATEAAALLDEYERLHYIPWNVKIKVDLANIARVRGRVDEAAEWCRRAKVPERNHYGGYAAAALALTFAQAGDSRASDVLEEVVRFVPRAGHPAAYGRWPTLNLVIEALATCGRVEDAAGLHAVAEDMIGMGFEIMFAGAALPRTTAGIAASCAGRWDRAEEHHRIAIRQAEQWGNRVCQPIARYWYAEMLLGRNGPGDSERAGDLLREAVGMFESLGMPLYGRLAGEKLAG